MDGESPVGDDFLRLLERAHSGDAKARSALFEANVRLVWSVVGRFRGRAETDDLFQVGSLGLLRAIDRFDPSFGVRFSTYAVPLIIGEIRRDLRGQGALKVSRGLRETAAQLARVRERIARDEGREPTLEETARAAGVELDEATLALESQSPVLSLDAPGREGEDTPSLADRLGDESDSEARWLDRLLVDEGVDALAPLERQVLRLRFFADLTQEETARRLGTNQVRVSRIERRALMKIRHRFLEPPAGGGADGPGEGRKDYGRNS